MQAFLIHLKLLTTGSQTLLKLIEESWSGCAFNCKGGAFLIHQERMVTTYGGQLCEDVKVGFPSNTMIGIISGEPHMQSQFATLRLI